MIFQFTWQMVLDELKNRTSRIVKPGDVELVKPLPKDRMFFQRDLTYVSHPANETREITGVERNGRLLYSVGQTYAVQPGRGKKSVARIQLTEIRREDVRCISLDDAHAEGFADEFEFMRVWVAMHDKQIHKQQYWGMKSIMDRPAEYYQAWVLTFKLVQL